VTPIVKLYMTVADKINFPNVLLSHVKLYVRHIDKMENFNTKILGFVVTETPWFVNQPCIHC
jgi:catechol-2,3-dioxygenase